MASYRVVTAGEVGFSRDDVLEKVRGQLGSSEVELDRRRLEHFASRMADSSWGRLPEVSGSPKPWTAPGRVASQTEVLDDLLDRAAGVEARVVTTLAARQADSHFRLRELARSSVERFAVAVARVPAAGLVVQKAPDGQVAYQPDVRSVPVQRNAAAGPPQDRVVVPKQLLDHRQPAPQSLDGQRRFYEAVVAASGHPGRRERADAVTVARSLAGRDVAPARLEAASRREQVLVGACVRDRLTATWGKHLVDAAGVSKALPETPGHAKRFAEARRWTRTATTSLPGQPVAPGRGYRRRFPTAGTEANRGHRKGGRVVVAPAAHPRFVASHVVDAVQNRPALGVGREVMHAHRRWRPLRLPSPARGNTEERRRACTGLPPRKETPTADELRPTRREPAPSRSRPPTHGRAAREGCWAAGDRHAAGPNRDCGQSGDPRPRRRPTTARCSEPVR